VSVCLFLSTLFTSLSALRFCSVDTERKQKNQSLSTVGVKVTSNESQFSDETYMTSAEWLRRHGIVARRLGFYDVLAGVAFKHEDGVLDLKVAPPCGDDEVIDAVSAVR